MLSTSNVSANQAAAYYTQEDACVMEQGQTGARWFGEGAIALKLASSVEPDSFRSLLQGFSPNGQALFGRSVGAAQRRAATDYTFSAPKSVSIAALVQQDERVLQAHQGAIELALSVLEERYAQTRISTATGRQYALTGNLIAAVFTHTTSREMEPQLHSHCVVMNATQLPDGRWYSFSNERAIAHQKLLGQIYQNELAVSLRRLGYEIELRSHGQFELAEYRPELLYLFSTRRQQILELLESWERKGVQILNNQGDIIWDSRSRREAAALQSRKHKARAIEPDKLVRGWNALVKLKGLELPPVPQGAIAAPPSACLETVLAERVEFEFQQTQLEQFVLQHHTGTWPFEEIQQAIGKCSVKPSFSPFLRKVNSNAQTSKTPIIPDRPDFSRSAEYSDRPCFESTPAIDAAGNQSTAAGDHPTAAGHTTVEYSLTALARSLDEHLESLAKAIADHDAEQCLSKCAGEFAATVAAVNQGIEHLEQSVPARGEFEAAIARLHAAARREIGRLESRLVEGKRQRSRQSVTLTKERYQQMWQRYRQGIEATHPTQLDREVARQAFADGQSRKAIALLLVAGSGYVQEMAQLQGKQQAMAYVRQIAGLTYLRQQRQSLIRNREALLEQEI